MPTLFDILSDDSERKRLAALGAGAPRARSRRKEPPKRIPPLSSWDDFVALDVETTGLEPAGDRVIEVAAVRFQNGKETDSFCSLVNPGRPIPAAVSALTGLSDQDVISAPPFTDILERLLEFVGTLTICGHQVEFDFSFLNEELKRAGRQSLTNPKLDTAALSRLTLPDIAGYSLTQVCRQLDIDLTKAHRALDDARASGRAAIALVPRLGDIPARVRRILADFAPRSLLKTLLLSATDSAGTSTATAQNKTPAWGKLKASGTLEITPDELERAFSSEGLGTVLSGYSSREQQTHMARLVAKAINTGEYLAIEAGTGTGKSLAYLIPAAMAALRAGQRVLVATHTRNLQDQLASSDLPIVNSLLGNRLRFSVLKGRSNYLCRVRYQRLLSGGMLNISPREREGLLPLIRWAEQTESGDIEEQRQFNRRWHSRTWTAICAESNGCCGSRCIESDRCFLNRARQRAQGAHIVVINHALFYSDLASDSSLLGPASPIIFDEAHHLEECGHRSLSTIIDTNRMNVYLNLCTDLIVRLEKSKEEFVAGAAGELRKLLRALRHHSEEMLAAVREWGQRGASPGREIRVELVPDALAGLAQCGAFTLALEQFQDEIIHLQQKIEQSPDEHDTTAGDIQTCSIQTSQMRADFEYLTAARTEGNVFWFESDREKQWIKLCGTPLDIGAWLAPIWANQERPVVFTSATLSIAGSLDYFCRRVGLSGQNAQRTRTALLATPFAASQSMRATVRTAPDPGSPAFAQFCADTVMRLQRKIMRNTLVLFTSHSMMREVDERIRKAGIERDFPLFSQVTGQSRTQLMQQFKRARQALLLGTSSFWEGVDAPGEQCEIVIIPRLPFQVPTEPLTQALARKAEEEFGESFFSYSVPEAIIRLRQGAGRLIRSAEDRGALVILDCRMVTKGYGRAFAASLDGPLETFDSIDSLESGVDTFFASEGGRRYVPVEEQGEETDDWQA